MTPIPAAVVDTHAYRAGILHFIADPSIHPHAYEWYEDGLLIVENGHIVAVGDYAKL